MEAKGRLTIAITALLALALGLALSMPLAAMAIVTPTPSPTPSITGVVTDSVTGEPVAGVEVWLEKNGAVVPACYMSTTTDALGRYTFSGVAKNYNYWIKINEAGPYLTYEGTEFPYTGTLVEKNIALVPRPLMVEGTVTVNGEPASGYKVKLWCSDASGCHQYVDYMWTEADGAFALYGEEDPGNYYLAVYDSQYNLVYQGDEFYYDGTTPASFTIDLKADAPVRLADKTRYATAVQIAREKFDPAGDGSWPGVNTVVIACGDDRAAADPLSASGLCGAYDAPLFLTSSLSLPYEVKDAIAQIVAANGPVKVYVVGGEKSVPQWQLDKLYMYVGAGKLTFERLAGDSRYDTAADVAREIKDKTGAPAVCLVANGADPSKFFDALSLSPVAASKGFPILLVSANGIPAETASVLSELAPGKIIVGGGTTSVSEAVRTKLAAERWAGNSRYSTAIVVADKAKAAGWLNNTVVGVAAKLPDALAGGSFCGMAGGVLVLTDGQSLSPATAQWLEANDTEITDCYLFGGQASLTGGVGGQVCRTLALTASEIK